VTRRRLNVLLIMADQLNPMVLPAYGGRARTPAIDRLAADGAVFDAAYCNSPLCAPSRAAFMTGRLPSRTGGYDNAAPFGSDIPTFAHLMRLKGYRTSLAGKMHFAGPDQLHGFEERLTTDIYPADFGWTPDWERPERRPSWYHNMSSVADAGTCVRTNQLDFDEEVAFTAERAIFDAARGADARPFCLVASLTHPHDPFAVPRRFFDLYSDEDAGLPRLGLGDVPLDPHSARLRHVSNMDVEPVSVRQVVTARRAYLGAVSFVDEIVGRLTRALEETGLADDTVVILTSDHGEMLGERGLWYKMSFLEGSARVPLIVHAPRHLPARRVAAAVSLVDLAPTLAGLAADGAAPEGVEEIDGRSLLPHLTSGAGHDEAIGEYLAEGAVAPVVMIRRGARKFVHSPVDPDQLFDVADDPDERVNLAADPAHADEVSRLRAEVGRRWDLAALDGAVRASQRRRRLVAAALAEGADPKWDHQPVRDASRSYIRRYADLDDLEARARFPRVRPATADAA
jgi:choline-sulfatase